MQGPEHTIELFHGYTYSAHPLACAAGIATLDLYRDEDTFDRAQRLEPRFAEAAMTLKGLPGVLDIRTVGIAAGIDLAPRLGAAGRARLRGDGPRLPRRGPGDPHHRRHACHRATADRDRGARSAEIFEKVGRVIRAVMS